MRTMKKEEKGAETQQRTAKVSRGIPVANLTFGALITCLILVQVWFHRRLLLLEENSLDNITWLEDEDENFVRVRRASDDHVEFVSHPQGRDSSNRGDNGVWLTSHSRIPLKALQDFCSATKDHCPPGPPGLPGPGGTPGRLGSKGEPGNPGANGAPGNRGHPGNPGNRGFPGPKGEPGIPGLPGTDGRDGLPGEPGLDGIPGRNGLDGIPGSDGIPGNDGRAGTAGRNGSDGTPGSQGPQGPQGPQGLPGPRGPPGINGSPGTPGVPGITAFHTNASATGKLLIPPSIVGSSTRSKPIEVKEEANVRLRCSASGIPPPMISWKRVDDKPITLGSWQSTTVEGPTLNLTRANRQHMGEYRCIADNGVPPQVFKTYNVEITFPPLIKISNQNVGGALGKWAILECEVEAFPVAVTYWERGEGRVMESNDKHRISAIERDIYKIRMVLNVTRINMNDLGKYFCVAKNIYGVTRGEFNVYELDPNKATPPPKGLIKFGKDRPELLDIDDLCPTPPPCPECPTKIDLSQCRSGGFALLDMVGWEMTPLGNLSFPKQSNRSQDCILSAVGKPVFNRFSANHPVGAWMRDPVKAGTEGERYYVTIYEDQRLFEYANKSMFQNSKSSRNVTLPFSVKGNYHAIYNGSFYYVSDSGDTDTPRIINVDIASGTSHKDVLLPYASFKADSLYKSKHSWVDLATDENGLWAIHTLMDSNNTAILKIDPQTLDILHGWNITISHRHAGDMFVICGVLYAVDDIAERETKIRLALDLYKRQLHKVDLSFANPFQNTSFVSYNPRTRELFTWDKGNQLIYPIKYTAMEEART